MVTICKKKEINDEDVLIVLDKLKKNAKSFFKDYQQDIDIKVMKEMLGEMKKNMNNDYLPAVFVELEKNYNSDFSAFTDDLFDISPGKGCIILRKEWFCIFG